MAVRRARDYSTDQRKALRPRQVRARYAADFHDLRAALFVRADSSCEGIPDGPACGAQAGGIHPASGSRVRLQVAHLDRNILNNSPENLRLLCERCHVTIDADQHGYSARWRTLVQEIGLWEA